LLNAASVVWVSRSLCSFLCQTGCVTFFYGLINSLLTLLFPLLFIPKFITPGYGWICWFSYHWFAQYVSLQFFVTLLNDSWDKHDLGDLARSRSAQLPLVTVTEGSESQLAHGNTSAAPPIGSSGASTACAELSHRAHFDTRFFVSFVVLETVVFYLSIGPFHWSFVEKITFFVVTYLHVLFFQAYLYRRLAEQRSWRLLGAGAIVATPAAHINNSNCNSDSKASNSKSPLPDREVHDLGLVVDSHTA